MRSTSILGTGLACFLSMILTGVAYGDAFPAAFDFSSLDGTNGLVLHGIDVSDHSGVSVSGAGDMNGDGFDDVIIGAYLAFGNQRGETYVVFGSDLGLPASLDLSTLNGTNGFVLNGIDANDESGMSVSGAGDLNGDGLSDVVIGAWRADPGGNSNAGESYVVFGSDQGFAPSLDLSTLDGTNGFVLNGIDGGDGSGFRVSAAGDVNADGIDDILIGAPFADNDQGESYVVFGSDAGFPASFDLSTLNGTNGFALSGIDANDHSAWSLSGAGDVNADGISDVVIGAPRAFDNDRGESYVVFGSDSGFPASLDLSTLDGTNGFFVRGMFADDHSGTSVSGAGDVNGDGISDIVIGSPDAFGNDRGVSHVVFGSDAGFPALVRLVDLDGADGFGLNGIEISDHSGISVSGAGDMNGDGVSDLVIGAFNAGPDRAGESYVFYGRQRLDCLPGTVNEGNGALTDVLYVQGSAGGADRTVEATTDDITSLVVLAPPAGGNGKFVIHADVGCPEATLQSALPADIGITCFPFLLPQGTKPVIVANNVGKANLVGESNFFGEATADPDRAPTAFFYEGLPIGMTVTFQGIIVDPASLSPQSASTTNAVTLMVVP